MGDDVLVLQPLAGKPLDLKRVEPCKIIKQISPVDYLIEFPNTRKPQRVIHVNLLRKYVYRTEYVSVVNAHEWDDDEAMTLVLPRDEDINEQLLGKKTAHLKPVKAEQMCNLIRGYNSVISDKPDCTDVVVHDIKLKPNSQPVNQKPYRMSPREKEIKTLVEEDLIEESFSEWSSPIMLLPKPPDASSIATGRPNIRTIIDYRHVNNL